MRNILSVLALFISSVAFGQPSSLDVFRVPDYTISFSGGIDLINANPGEAIDASAGKAEIYVNRIIMSDPYTHFVFGAGIGFSAGNSAFDPTRSFMVMAEAGVMAEQQLTVKGRAYYHLLFRQPGYSARINMSPMDWRNDRMLVIQAYMELGMTGRTGYASVGLCVPVNLKRKPYALD